LDPAPRLVGSSDTLGVPRETFTPRYGKKREADFSVEGELAHEPRRKCPVEKFSVKEDSVSYKSIER